MYSGSDFTFSLQLYNIQLLCCVNIICRIDENWIIKVADFGLTRSVYEKRYFRQAKDESVKLPIKWMAIESIDDAVFTEKTDVVS